MDKDRKIEERKQKLAAKKREVADKKLKREREIAIKEAELAAQKSTGKGIDNLLQEIENDPTPIEVTHKQQMFIPTASASKQELKFATFVGVWDIPPRLSSTVNTYEQGIQVEFMDDFSPMDETEEIPIIHDTPINRFTRTSMQVPKYSGGKKLSMYEAEGPRKGTNEDTQKVTELSKEECKVILNSTDFNQFFERASKILERALDQVDTTINPIEDEVEGDEIDQGSGEPLKLQITFPDDLHSIKRAVSKLQWSQQHNEFIMASYTKSEEYSSQYEQDGLILLWSLNLRKRPEFQLFCQSEITSAVVHPFMGNIVVGGTYSGSIVLWDVRAQSTPVQSTPLSSQAHSHPIYSIQIVGTKNAHNIVSVSNNGRMCLWNTNMLNQPNKFIDLKIDKEEVCAQAVAFAGGETNNFFVGAEDSKIYQGQIHSNVEEGADKHIFETYEGHFAPITSLAFHPSHQSKTNDFSDLMLSSSIDWTVKLWCPKRMDVPILSMERASDYVLDAEWSPSHPSVFASSDAEGYIDLWNLNKDTEEPFNHYNVGDKAINKITWSNDAKKLAAGDSAGAIYIFNTDKEFVTPRNEDFAKFDRIIQSHTRVSNE